MKTENKKAIVINLFGGPGVGKTATALSLTGLLRKKGISCDYASEGVKDHVYESNLVALDCQPAIAGEQIKRLHRLDKQVKIIITDSPILINTLHPGFGVTELYKSWLVEIHNMFNNFNIVLQVDREKQSYEQKGRTESKERATEMDKENIDMLNSYNVPFETVEVNELTELEILFLLEEKGILNLCII